MNRSYLLLIQAKPMLLRLALLVAMLVLVSLFVGTQIAAAQSNGVFLPLVASGTQTANSTMPVQATASVGQCMVNRFNQTKPANVTDLNCTSNDVQLATYQLISGPTSCLPGEAITIGLKGEFLATASERYDVGVFVAMDGGTPNDLGGMCYNDYLHSASINNNTDINLTGGSGPFYNAETGAPTDTCGDIRQGNNAFLTINTISLVCQDSNSDGTADVGSCTVWANSASLQANEPKCTSELNTTAETTAKCTCANVPITGLIVPKTGTIKVDKVLTPITDPGKFSLQIDGTTKATDVGNNGTTGVLTVSAGLVPPGTGNTHTVGEIAGTSTDLANYHSAIACTSNQNHTANASNAGPLSLTVLPNENWVCTITNTPKTGKLEVVKKLIPSNDPGKFNLSITGVTTVNDVGDGGTTGEQTINPGSYSIGETAGASTSLGNYNSSVACVDTANNNAPVTVTNSQVSVLSNQDIVCTFTNTRKQGMITFVKMVVGGSAQASEWTFDVTGGPQNVAHNGTATLNTGSYIVTENSGANNNAGYILTAASGVCALNNGQIALTVTDAGGTCTVTNEILQSAIQVVKTGSPAVVNPNGSVTYQYTVTNPGQTPLTLSPIAISDDKCSPISSPTLVIGDGDNFLEPGEAWRYTCTMQLTVDTTNTVVVTGTPPVGPVVTNRATAFVDVRPTIIATKTANPTSVPESGEDVTFTFIITNTSSEVVTTTALSDSVFGNLAGQNTCAINQPIQPGASYTCFVVKPIAGDYPGSHNNTMTATVVDDEGNEATASPSAIVTFSDVLPSVILTKTVDPSTRNEPGGLFTFTLTIHNTSAETATIQSLTDTYQASFSSACTNLIGTQIPPNQTRSCTYQVTLTNPGTYINTARVVVEDDDTNQANDEARATATINNVPSALLVYKTANPIELVEPGGEVTFTVLITNTSATDTVTVTTFVDDTNNDGTNDVTYVPSVICDKTVLAPAAVATCTFKRTLSGNSGDVLTDNVTASGTDDDGGSVSNNGRATVTIIDVNSALDLSKTPSPASLPEPGGLVTFTLRMTNTSQADVITITVLSDTIFNDVTTSNHDGITFTNCLLPHVLTLLARSYECYFVAQVAGNALFQHQNNVVARGIDDDNQAVSAGANAQVNITDLASNMIVTKTATPSSVPETGGLVTYTVVVQNLSAVDSISVTTVTDNHFGDIGSSCTPVVTPTMPVLLTPGASINCSFTRLLPPGNFGTNHTNEVTAFAIDDDNQSLTKKDSEIVTYSDTLGLLEVIKTANSTSVPESGGVVTYSVVVRNISVADTITVTSVSDDKFGDIGNHCTPVVTGITPVVLAAGQSFNCTFLGTLLPGNVGSVHTNTVTARGIDDDGGDPVEARGSESVTYSDLPASLLVTKAANVASVSLAGAIVTFTLRVENSSAADGITINTLLDSVYGNVADAANPQLVNTTCVTGTTLALNGVYQCQFSAFVSGRVGDSHINTVTVRATDSDNQPISGQDSETITIDDVIIEASKSDALVQDVNQDGIANPGDVVGYTIVVRNSGNVAATGVVFNDQLEPNVALINNTVTASPIGVVELGNNAGDVNVRVNIGTLAAQAAVTIRFNVRIDNPLPLGVTHIANQGQVSGTNFPTTPSDDPQTPTPDDPTVTPIVAQPLISSSKRDQLVVDADNDGFVSPGDTLEYRVFIVNNGNQAATGIVFRDTPDANTNLLVGSVQTSQGTIIRGNTAGNTTVQVEVGTLTGNGGNVAILFRVRIVNPLPTGVTQVSNQGVVSGGNILNVRTDDPDTAPTGDPTDTPISAAPLLDASKRAALLVDADNNGVPSPGDTINYQITIINRGNTAATDVLFDDQPDANTSLVVGSVRTTQGSVTSGNIDGNKKVSVQVGTLAGNDGEVTITYDVRIHNPLPAAIAEIKNQGLVTSRQLPPLPTDDPVTPDPDDPTKTPVRFAPQLDVNKAAPLLLDTDGNGIASPGDSLIYSLEVFNRGNGPATNVVIEDVIEANMKLVNGSVQASLGSITSGNNPGDSKISVTVAAIPGSNGVVVISFRTVINNPLLATVGEVRNQAVVQSNGLPPTLSDDPAKGGTQDPTITPVAAKPILELSKEDIHINLDNDPNVTLTDELLYRITIVNHGNTAASNVSFSDTPDPQTALINGSVQTTAGTIEDGNDSGDKSIKVNIGTIPAGGTVTISFRVVIIGNKNNVVRNQAVVEYANPINNRELPTTVVSNDPATLEAADPTLTFILVPNALEGTEEPQMKPALYLPFVAR